MRVHLVVVAVVVFGLCLSLPIPSDAEGVDFSIGYTSGNQLTWVVDYEDALVEATNSMVITNHGDERQYSFMLTFDDFTSGGNTVSVSDNMGALITTENGEIPLEISGNSFSFSLWLEPGEFFYFAPYLNGVPNVSPSALTSGWEFHVTLAGSNRAPDVFETVIGEMYMEILPYLEFNVDMLWVEPDLAPGNGQESVRYGNYSSVDLNVSSNHGDLGLLGGFLSVRNQGNTPVENWSFNFDNLTGPEGEIFVYDEVEGSNCWINHTYSPELGVFVDEQIFVNETNSVFIENGTLYPGMIKMFTFGLGGMNVPNGTYVGDFNFTAYGNNTNTSVNESSFGYQLSQEIYINYEPLLFSATYVDEWLAPSEEDYWHFQSVIGGGNFTSKNLLRIENIGNITLNDMNITLGPMSNGVDTVNWTGEVTVVAYDGENVSLSVGDVLPITDYNLTLGLDLLSGNIIVFQLDIVVDEDFIPVESNLTFSNLFVMNASCPFDTFESSSVLRSDGRSDMLIITYNPLWPNSLTFPILDVGVPSDNTMLVLNQHFLPLNSLKFYLTEMENETAEVEYELFAVVGLDMNPYDDDFTTQQFIFESENRSLTIYNPLVKGMPILLSGKILSLDFVILEVEDGVDVLSPYEGAFYPGFNDIYGHSYSSFNDMPIYVLGADAGEPDIEVSPERYQVEELDVPTSFLATVDAEGSSYDITFRLDEDTYPCVVDLKVYEDLDASPVATFTNIHDTEEILYHVSENTTIFVEVTVVGVGDGDDDDDEFTLEFQFRAKRGNTLYDTEHFRIVVEEEDDDEEAWYVVLLAGAPGYVAYGGWLAHTSALVPEGILGAIPAVMANKRQKRRSFLRRYQFHIAWACLSTMIVSTLFLVFTVPAIGWPVAMVMLFALTGLVVSSVSIHYTTRSLSPL